MPSTKTTLRVASTLGGIGHIAQNRAVFLRNVLPPPGMSGWRERVRSQARKAESCLAALSILQVVLAPQEVHLHRVLPALVLPFLAILLPQTGQFGAPM